MILETTQPITHVDYKTLQHGFIRVDHESIVVLMNEFAWIWTLSLTRMSKPKWESILGSLQACI